VESAIVYALDRSEEDWGFGVNVPNLQAIKFDPLMDNDELRIFGSLEHLLSVLTAVDVTLDLGGIDATSEPIITGFSATTSGSGAGEQRTTRQLGAALAGYFALQAQIVADDGGDAHLMLPCMMLSQLIPVEIAKTNQFMVENVKARAVRLVLADGTQHAVMEWREHAAAATIETAFPLTDFWLLDGSYDIGDAGLLIGGKRP
jgi:hypothetical protein